MYSIEWAKVFRRQPNVRSVSSGQVVTEPASQNEPKQSGRWAMVSQTVFALGLTSLLTDISSEMVASILPAYLVLHLGISPLGFGIIDGIYQGAAAIVRLASGVLADRWRQHKQVAAWGYGLSAACRLLILFAGSGWAVIAGIITIDRIGKGIRTAPRDALISNRSPKSALATSFGVHRAMDAIGAMLGPVFAFALLALIPGSFDVLFVASFGIAVMGLAAILLFVPASTPDEQETSPSPEAISRAGHIRCPRCHTPDLPCPHSVSLRSTFRLLAEGRFRGMVVAGVLLSLVTISDSFIYLVLFRRLDVGVTAFPLFYVGTSLCTSLFAIPFGRFADRIGRMRVLIGGYVVLSVVYALLLVPAGGGWMLIAAVVFLLGVFYAATDGVLTAMTAAVLPISHVGSGLAVFATATNLARLVASIAFGFLWSRSDMFLATILYMVALALTIGIVVFVLKMSSRQTTVG